MNASATYRAFILRMWTEERDTQDRARSPWRFSLEPISTTEEARPDRPQRRGFANVDELLGYLLETMGLSP